MLPVAVDANSTTNPHHDATGGHLSHGYQTDTKKISAVSIFFEVCCAGQRWGAGDVCWGEAWEPCTSRLGCCRTPPPG